MSDSLTPGSSPTKSVRACVVKSTPHVTPGHQATSGRTPVVQLHSRSERDDPALRLLGPLGACEPLPDRSGRGRQSVGSRANYIEGRHPTPAFEGARGWVPGAVPAIMGVRHPSATRPSALYPSAATRIALRPAGRQLSSPARRSLQDPPHHSARVSATVSLGVEWVRTSATRTSTKRPSSTVTGSRSRRSATASWSPPTRSPKRFVMWVCRFARDAVGRRPELRIALPTSE
jgi:hypothetical protein